MKPKSSYFRALSSRAALATTILISYSLAAADTVTWDGGAGDSLWTTGLNWNTDAVPTAAHDLVFDTGSGLVLLNGNQTANSLAFSNNFTLGAYGVATTLTTTLTTIPTTTDDISISSGKLVTMNAAITKTTGNIVLSGGGTLFLNNPQPSFNGNWIVDGAGTTLLHRPAGATNQYSGVGAAIETPRGDLLALGVGTGAKTITLQNGGTYRTFGASINPDGGFKNFVIGSGGGTMDVASGWVIQNFDDAGQIVNTTEAFTKTGKGRLVLTNGAADSNPLGGIVNINGGMLSLDRQLSQTVGTNTYVRFSGIAGTGTTVNINSGGTLLINNGTAATFDAPAINANDGSLIAFQGTDHFIGYATATVGGPTVLTVGDTFTSTFLTRDLFNPQQQRAPRLRAELDGTGTLEISGSTGAGNTPRLVIERSTAGSDFSGTFRLVENTSLEANPRFNTSAAGGTGTVVDTGKVLAGGDIEFAGWGGTLDLRDSNPAAASVLDYTTNEITVTTTQAGALNTIAPVRATAATGTGHLFNFGTLTMGNHRIAIGGNNSYQTGFADTAGITGNAVIEMRSDNSPLVFSNASAISEDAAGRSLTLLKTGGGGTAPAHVARDVISGGAISLSNLQVATGTLQLRGAGGAITTGFGGAAPVITVNGGANAAYTNSMPVQGLLHLDSSIGHVVGTNTVFAAAENTNRIVDSATLNLWGNSTLRLTSLNNSGTTETIGTTNVTGHGTFDVIKTGTAPTPVALTVNTLNMGPTATANFTGTSLGLAGPNTSRIVAGLADGILGSQFHSGNEWANYSNTLDNGLALGATPLVAGNYTLNSNELLWAGTQQIKRTSTSVSISGNRNVARMNLQYSTTGQIIDLSGFVLTLDEGGVITSTNTTGFSDLTSSLLGGITAGTTAPAKLNFYANVLTDIKVPIINNLGADQAIGGGDDSAVDFIKSGTNTLRLTHHQLGVGLAGQTGIDPYTAPTWSSTLTGSWIINDGRLEVQRGQFLGGRPVILDGGHLEINEPVSNANADSIIPGWGNNITINANAAVAADDNGESHDNNTGDRAMVKLGSLTINNGAVMGHSSFSDIDIAYMGGATFNGTPTLDAIRGGANSATIINGALTGTGFNMIVTNGNASVVLGGGSPDTTPNTYNGAITAYASTLRLNKANGVTAVTDGAAAEDIVINGGAIAWGPGQHGDLSTTNNINLTNNGLTGIAPTSPAAVLAAGMNQIADTADITLLFGTLGENDRITNETFGSLIQKNGTFNVGLGSIVVADATISGGAFNINPGGSFTAGTLTLQPGAPDLNITTGIPAGAQTTLEIGTGGLSMTGQNITLGTGSSTNVMGSGGILKLGGNVTHTGSDLIGGSYGRKGIFVNPGNTFRQLGNSKVDLMGDNRTFTVDADSIFTVTAPIVNGGLVKSGGGALVLEPFFASTFVGPITVNDGVLEAKGDGAFGTSAGGVTINNGGTVKLNSGWTYGDNFLVTGPGALVTGGLGVREVGALVAESGTNRLTGTVAISGDTTLAGNTFLDGSATPAGGGMAYRIGTLRIESVGGLTGSGTVTLSGHGDGVIVNGINTTGGVNKDGAGRWTISKPGTYAGATIISAGTLRITDGAALGTTGTGTTVYGGGSLELTGGILVAEPMTLGGAGSSTQSGAIVNLGGVNTLTGPINLLSGATLRAAAGTFNVNNSVTGLTETSLTLSGAGTGTINGKVTVGTPLAGDALTKNGRGTWTLSGNNSISGSTAINGGLLILNSTGTALNAASALNLGGGSLTNTGAAQTVNGLNLLAGGGTVNGGANLSIGAITRSTGATANFAGTVTTSSSNTNDILGAYATYGGGWATVGSGGSLAGYAAYTPLATALLTSDNATIAVGALAAPANVNSLRISGPGLNLGANNLTLASGGLLYTGTGNDAITGTGLLSGVDGTSELIVQTLGTGTLDIAAPLIGAGAGGLTKAGSGTLVLSGTNAFTGPITITEGTLAIVGTGANHPAALGAQTGIRDIVINGGTFRVLGDYNLNVVGGVDNMRVVVGSPGGTIHAAFGGNVLMDDANEFAGTGDLTITGGGRVGITQNNSTFTGDVVVNSGILTVGNAFALGGRQEQTITLKSGSAIINSSGFGLGQNGIANNIVAEGGVEFFQAGGNRVYSGDIQLSGTNTIALFELDALNSERQMLLNGRVSGTGVTLNVFGVNNGNPLYLASGSNDLTGTINLNPNAILEARTPGSLGINDGDVTVNMATNSRLLLRHFQNGDYHTNVVVNGHAEINSDRLATFAGGAQQFLSVNDLTVNGDNTILTVGGGNNYYTRVEGTMILNGTTSNILNVTASDLLIENGLLFGTTSSTLDKRGSFSAILRQPSNHTGTLIVQGGLIHLQDNGALPTTTSINLRGGELRVDNSNLLLADRINNGASLSLGGGTLRITGPETIGTVAAASGTTNIIFNQVSETVANTLNLPSFSRSLGATVNFASDFGGAVGSDTLGNSRVSSRITIDGQADVTGNSVVPGLFGNSGLDFVQYDGTATDSFTGLTYGLRELRNPTPINGPTYQNDTAETAWDDADIVRVTTAKTLTASRALEALKVEAAVTIAMAANNLRIETGGILTVANAVTLSSTTGVLTAGVLAPSEGTAELFLGGNNTLTLSAIVGDNTVSGQKVAVIKTGTGQVNLDGNNTYTGGLYVNSGTLNTTHANFNGSTASTITLAGGTLQFNIANATTIGDLGVPDHAINVVANSQIVLDNGSLAGIDNDITLGALTINGPYTLGLRSLDSMDATFTGTHTFAGTPMFDMAQATGGGNQLGFFTINGEINGSGFQVGSSGDVDNTVSVLQIGGGEAIDNIYTGKVTVLLGVGSTGARSEDLRVELNKAAGSMAITADSDNGTVDLEINGGVVRNIASDQIHNDANIVINQGQYHLNGLSETVASVTMNGGNVLTAPTTLTAPGGTFTITGPLTVNGLDDLTGGTNTGFTIGNNSTTTVGGLITIGNYGRIHLSEGQTAGVLNVNGGLQMTGGLLSQNNGPGLNIVRLSSDVTTVAAAYPSRLGNSADSDTFLELNGTRTFTVADGPAGLDLSVSTILRNAFSGVPEEVVGNFVKAGPGTLQLEGSGNSNRYTGTSAVNEGTVVLFKSVGYNAIPAGALTIGDGTGGANADQVVVRNSQQIADANEVTIASSGLLDLSTFNTSEQIGSLSGSGNVILGAGSVLTIGGTTPADFSGTIEGGGGGFTKSGTGSQVLSGSNTYAGITNVNGGSLYVNGTHNGGGDYNVADTATLGGEGSITGYGNVTYAGGSTLQVGNPTDTGAGHDLAFNLIGTGSAFTLNSSTTLSLDLWANLNLAAAAAGTNQSDVLAVTAPTINLAGILNVANPANISSWAVGDTFDLFDWFTTPTGTFTSVNLPEILTPGLTWDTSNLYTMENADPALSGGTIKVVAGSPETPIQSWRKVNFGATANAGNGADNADPDKDGVPNVTEYALGMNPNISSLVGLPTLSTASGSGTLSFDRNLSATDVKFIVQASNDLDSWTDLATRNSGSTVWSSAPDVAVADDSLTGEVSVKDNVTVAAQSKRFQRLVIINPLP